MKKITLSFLAILALICLFSFTTINKSINIKFSNPLYKASTSFTDETNYVNAELEMLIKHQHIPTFDETDASMVKSANKLSKREKLAKEAKKHKWFLFFLGAGSLGVGKWGWLRKKFSGKKRSSNFGGKLLILLLIVGLLLLIAALKGTLVGTILSIIVGLALAIYLLYLVFGKDWE
jgi:hypothetical protein